MVRHGADHEKSKQAALNTNFQSIEKLQNSECNAQLARAQTFSEIKMEAPKRTQRKSSSRHKCQNFYQGRLQLKKNDRSAKICDIISLLNKVNLEI